MPLQTYQEALARIEPAGTTSLLMGNGFSRALYNQIFDYANLFDKADFGDRAAVLRDLFTRLGTFDFEAVMRLLESAESVLESYGREDTLLARVRADQEVLKNALIAAISQTHPARPHDIDRDKFTSTREFLAGFGEIFTVNYDLLFYWARNQDNLPPPNYRTDDGFRQERVWHEYGTNQKIHFLHGGLHIYEDDSTVKKLAHAHADVAIIDQVQGNLNLGKFPLFVSEPSADKKRKRIERNPYLNYCFRALRNTEGTMVVLGHSMDPNDQHIFEQIRASRVANALVSIHGDENNRTNTTTRANAIAFLQTPTRRVEFFDASTVPVWV